MREMDMKVVGFSVDNEGKGMRHAGRVPISTVSRNKE